MNPDIWLFRLINGGLRNGLFDRVMPCIAWGGTGELWIVIALAFLLIRSRRTRAAALLICAGLTISYYSVSLAKDMVGRLRPFEILAGVNVLVSANGFSFPSGHTVTACMGSYLLWSFFGKPFVFFTAAGLVGFSRIYTGVHYPLDVAVGAFFGIGLGFLLVKVYNSLENKAP